MMKNELYILITLLEGEMHGYIILSEVKKHFSIDMHMTTLYRTLKHMISQGLITKRRTVSDSIERKKIYKITQKGVSLLNLELESMGQCIKIAKKRMRRMGKREKSEEE
jgi:DNA-binding PadR family transcriptional regulator